MEELIKRLERVIQTGVPDKDGMHPISAEAALEVVKGLSKHSTNLAEVGTDAVSREAVFDALRTCYDTETITMDNGDEYINYGDAVGEAVTAIQPDNNSETPNSSDVISRQAAIDAVDQIFDRCEEIEAHLPEGDPDRTGYKMYPDYMTVWKYLHQLPSAQPEIVRCKECKHYEHGICKKAGLCVNKSPNGFCDWGERREVAT